MPVDAITAILDAFRSYPLVALGEGPHNNFQGHLFRLSLIRDARFAATVNDIVVEFGSARYQELMDRFVRGEDVPNASLRQVWQNTTVATTVWESPIYEEFFMTVRAINASLPEARRLRVLLGDAPIDWDAVRTADDLRKWGMDKDPHATELIRREVLAKQRRALIIYGDGHFQGRSERPPRSLVARLDADGTKTFLISSSFADLATLQRDVASWPVPSLAMIRGTPIGVKEYEFFYGASPPGDYWRSQRLEDQFDAILYLGPPSSMTMAPFPIALCSDAVYVKMRLERMSLVRSTPVERLRECPAPVPR